MWDYWRTVFFRYAPITKLLQRKVNIIYYSAIYKTRNTGIENGMSGMHGTRGMFTMIREVSERIPGNVLILAFRRMLGKIPGNVQKDFGECFRGFRECWRRSWGILLKIPRNVPEDSWGGSRSFREMFKRSPGNVQEDSGESKFRFISWKLACFLSNFAVKLLRNNGKKRLLSNFPKESTFFTTTYD